MERDPQKAEIASRVIDRYLNMREGTGRHPLSVLVRDAAILDEMERLNLLRAEKNRTEYYPTLGTFALLDDKDERYIFAREGTERVLHTLINLYETRDPATDYSGEELVEHVRVRYDEEIDERQIRLGLYLSVFEFGAIRSHRRSDDGIDISAFSIAESVLKIFAPSISWNERIALSRANALRSSENFESRAKLSLDLRAANLYEGSIEECRKLVGAYDKAGIAHATAFARQMAPAVLAAFSSVEDLIRQIYLTPKANELPAESQDQLSLTVSSVLEEQTARGRAVMKTLCMSFLGSSADVLGPYEAQVSERGKEINSRLQRELGLKAAPSFLQAVSESSVLETAIASQITVSASTNPSVFISYAWDGEEHEDWVKHFTKQLRDNGVNAILDGWALNYGDNRFQFMEQIASVDAVLIVCTPKYAEKANARIAGVGYESNIITSSMADEAGVQKFVPVLRSGDWSTSVPIWLKHKLGADLRDHASSDKAFNRLLRTLHGKKVEAPPLGPVPRFEDEFIPQQRPLPRNLITPNLTSYPVPKSLNVREHDLLDAAVQDSSGQISHRTPIGKDIITANGKSFLDGASHRERAAWLEALRSLERLGLVVASTRDRSFFEVTDLGYKTYDGVGRFQRWNTTKVELAAYYVNIPAEVTTVKCCGVVVIPEIYTEHLGVDGYASRSIDQARSLLIEGVDQQEIDNLKFDPTDLIFADATGGEEQTFRLDGRLPSEQGTLLFETMSA